MTGTTHPALRWLASLDEALQEARDRNMLVLLDFFSPT
jgi:hypothetical protein